MMCPVKHTAGKPDSNCNICQSECNTHTETKHMIIYIREAVLCPCTTESNADYMYTVCFSQGTAMTSKLATYRQCFVIMLLHVIIVVNVQFLQYRLPVHWMTPNNCSTPSNRWPTTRGLHWEHCVFLSGNTCRWGIIQLWHIKTCLKTMSNTLVHGACYNYDNIKASLHTCLSLAKVLQFLILWRNLYTPKLCGLIWSMVITFLQSFRILW